MAARAHLVIEYILCFTGEHATQRGTHTKRSVRRALRQYYIAGYMRYKGHLISDDNFLARYFDAQDINAVRELFAVRRTHWMDVQQPSHLLRADGAVHVPAREKPPSTNSLHMVTFNAESLVQYGRLRGIAEDLDSQGICVAALQGTRLRTEHCRDECVLKNRHGENIYY
eukprot:6019338-Amphidinium_carterae.1